MEERSQVSQATKETGYKNSHSALATVPAAERPRVLRLETLGDDEKWLRDYEQ